MWWTNNCEIPVSQCLKVKWTHTGEKRGPNKAGEEEESQQKRVDVRITRLKRTRPRQVDGRRLVSKVGTRESEDS